MVIQHNLSALNTQRQYNINTGERSKIAEKLSSGYKINRAADDAAGLSISEKMRRQIRGLTQASANAKDGISMVQIADGAMAEIDEMLHRGTELAIKAANGTMSPSDRQDIQKEIDQIKTEIDQIPERTKFNEIYVLKGGVRTEYTYKTTTTTTTTTVVTGKDLPACVALDSVSEANKHMSGTYATSETYSYTDSDGNTVTDTYNMNHLSAYVDFSSFTPSDINDMIGKGFYCTCLTCNSRYSIKFNNQSVSPNPETSGQHYVYNVDISGCNTGMDVVNKIISTTTNKPNNHFTNFAADGDKLIMYDNRSSDSNPTDITSLQDFKWVSWGNPQGFNYDNNYAVRNSHALFGSGVSTTEITTTTTTTSTSSEYFDQEDVDLQIGADNLDSNRLTVELPAISASLVGIEGVDVTYPEGAYSAIDSFADALFYVNEQRSRMGAYQNRLEHTIANLDNVIENTTAAESAIRDTDMSAAMVKYSMLNILAQAGESMMAQANNMNEGVLSLLQG